MLKSRWLWLVVLVLVASAVGGWLYRRKVRADREVHYDTVELDRGRIAAKVTATGTLSALVTVQVGSQVSGSIAGLYADFNSTVTKGQRIAKIEPSLFEAAMQQARANRVAAQGNLAKSRAQAVDADRQAKRFAALLARHLVAQADYDTAQSTADADRAAVDAAAGTVEQAKAQLHQAQVNLAYTDIISPTSGTVIARNVDVGQTVAASLQAPVLFLIARDLRKMQVDTSVAEADIGKIAPGMRATFTVDAYTGERFTGTVRQVRNSPQTVQNVVTYDSVIDVDNAQLKLKPGMTANCTFVYAERDDALRVPNAALRFLPPPELLAQLHPGGRSGRFGRGGQGGPGEGGEGGGRRREGASAGEDGGGGSRRGPGTGGRNASPDRRTLWVLRNGKPQPVRIKIGVSDGSLTEIADGGDLKAGDLVLTGVTVGNEATAAPTPGRPGAQQQNFPRRLF
ncbi:MAG TPA: efflux RND transporter periplasmic adaptor subunit [Thermoanaerobaculia bacterium]|nr:efflux RND transporter periplasmic adaptor subunit [Thermoanaerobaculia bacterium]